MKRKIFIIAAEASGDFIGSQLIKSMKMMNPEVEFFGIGGIKMSENSFNSIFPMSELSVMGFFEVIKHIPNILRRINFTVEEIKNTQPAAIVTIDSPGFCFRVIKKVRKLGIKSKFIHYVAPTVWAYKENRVKKVSELYDMILTLYPFENKYFEREKIKNYCVGHPIAEQNFSGSAETFKKQFEIDIDQKIIVMMPGSREKEIETMLPIFVDTAIDLKTKLNKIVFVFLTTNQLKEKIRLYLAKKSLKAEIIEDHELKKLALSASDLALVKSGTSTLEVAMSKVPMIATYKVSFLTAILLKFMLKIKLFSLPNILLKKQVIPEFIQEKCNYLDLSKALVKLLFDLDAREKQLRNFEELRDLIIYKGKVPSLEASSRILDLINEKK